jgi:fructose-specific phosphotransferase system IIA component
MEKLINEKLIFLKEELDSKDEIITFMASKINDEDRLHDMDKYIECVYEREKSFPTCVGFHVAIPHGKSGSVKTPTLAFVSLKNHVVWHCDDSVKLVFMIAVPSEYEGNFHLKVLAELSKNLMHDEFREKLLCSEDKGEIESMLSFSID